MKRILIIMAIAIAASSAAFGQTKMSKDKNNSVETQIITMEKAGWEAWKNKNGGWFQTYLTEDALNVNGGGVYNKAQIAIQSALTGHLVFTTVHANNVIDVIGRFLNMGVEPYNFVSSLNCVLAQRLVRLICPACKRPHRPSSEELIQSGLRSDEYRNHTYYTSIGCDHCNHTGYRGRTSIHELLGLTDNIRDMIVERRPASEIRRAAQAEGLSSLRASALQKLIAGLTSLREINRVTFAEETKQ